MQRDWDLVRRILLALEAKPHTGDLLAPEAVDPTNPRLVSYHFKLLSDAGLIHVVNVSWMGNTPSLMGTLLSSTAHELMCSMQSGMIWEKVKTRAKERGLELTHDVIIQLAREIVEDLTD